MVRARIPGWSRPLVFLDVVTFSAGFRGFSKVFVTFTHAFHAFFEGFPGFSLVWLRVVFGFPDFQKNANPFVVLSSAYFGDAVTDHVSRGSVLFFGFPDFSKKLVTHLAACGLAPGGRRLQAPTPLVGSGVTVIKATAMIKAKAMIKAIPPLPLRSLVGVTKNSQELSKISPNVLVCFLLGIGAPSPPARENKHGP